MLNWITEHLTLPYVLVFVFGLMFGYFINWWVCTHRVNKNPDAKVPKRDGFLTIVGVVIIITMIWIMVSVQQARNCAIELNVAVAQDVKIGKMEREAFQNAVIKSQAVPAAIQDLPQNDPARKAYMDPITDEYLGIMAQATELRKANEFHQTRAAKACGTQ